MSKTIVPATYWTSAERHELIGELNDTLYADGLALTVFHERTLAHEDRRPMSEVRLVQVIPPTFMQACFDSGLLVRMGDGLLRVGDFDGGLEAAEASSDEPKEKTFRDHTRDRKKRLEGIYALYPPRDGGSGKSAGLKSAFAKFKSDDAIDRFERSVKNYARAVTEGRVEAKFIPMFSTFVSRHWEDWTDDEVQGSPDSGGNPFASLV